MESCAACIQSLRDDREGKDLPYKANLVAWVDPRNKGSLRVCEKLGFKEIELKKFGEPPKVKLGDAYREDGVLVLGREL